MVTLYLLVIILLIFYAFVKRQLSYWKRRGVPYIEPHFFFGNTMGVDYTIHNSEFWKKMYTRLKGKGPIVGVYVYTVPVAMITDLNLAKRIFIKDFDYFCNRGGFLNEKAEPWTAHLVNIEDDRWRKLRSILSPLFVSGKLKNYFQQIKIYTDTFINVLENENNPEMYETVTRLVIDVLGGVLLSLEFNQLKGGKNELFEIISEVMNALTFTKKTYAENYRWLLADILGIKVVPKKIVKVMDGLVSDYQKRREVSENTKDLMGLLYGLYEKNDIGRYEIVGNAGAFFIGGQDNINSSITHTLYELAKNPEIQQRCREHIKEVMTEHDIKSMDELTYDAIMDMTFLEQCIMGKGSELRT